jgi:excisionase family DNA binding protein
MKALMTVDELSEYLQLKPSTVLYWARRGWIPCIRLSNKVIRFDPKAVESHLVSKGLIGDRHAADDQGP